MDILIEHGHTDEDLVKLSLTDKHYFGELVDRYERKLRRYVKRIGRLSVEDEEDLLQNIFIKTYQNLNAFDVSLKFSSWVYRIAHNETVSFFRHRSVRPEGHAEYISDEEFNNLASELDIHKELETKEIRKAVVTSLSLLDAKYKDILFLKYFEYKSYDEISDILLIPPGTVAVRLSRAKERMKGLLISNGYTHE
jgi:RNA polymerase sigma-70 factor (ECF subfamily)